MLVNETQEYWKNNGAASTIIGAGEKGSSVWCLKLAKTGPQERIKCRDAGLEIICQVKGVNVRPLFLDEVESIRPEKDIGQ